jgi:hypothetical protein
MERSNQECPFQIGDCVVFTPNDHAVGWSWSAFDRVKLKPGDKGIITRIEKGRYLYLDDGRGGFHWQCHASCKMG